MNAMLILLRWPVSTIYMSYLALGKGTVLFVFASRRYLNCICSFLAIADSDGSVSSPARLWDCRQGLQW